MYPINGLISVTTTLLANKRSLLQRNPYIKIRNAYLITDIVFVRRTRSFVRNSMGYNNNKWQRKQEIHGID